MTLVKVCVGGGGISDYSPGRKIHKILRKNLIIISLNLGKSAVVTKAAPKINNYKNLILNTFQPQHFIL